MNGTLVADDVARGRALGVRLILSTAQDRAPADQPATLTGETGDPRGDAACPTCDDGYRTITHPERCRECEHAGL